MDPSLIKSQLSAWKLHTSEFKELQKIARALMKSGDRELIRIGAELLSCGVAHETFGDLNLRRFLVCADIIFFLVQGPEWIADKNTSFRMSQLHKFDAEFEINKRQLWPTLKEGDLDLAGLAPGTYVREVLESASKMQLEAGISVDEIHPLPEYISSAAGADHVSPELEAGVRLHIVLEELRKVLHRAEAGQIGTGEVQSPLTPSDDDEVETAREHVELKRIIRIIWMEQFPNLPNDSKLPARLIPALQRRLSMCSKKELALHHEFLESKYDCLGWKEALRKKPEKLKLWISRGLIQALPPEEQSVAGSDF